MVAVPNRSREIIPDRINSKLMNAIIIMSRIGQTGSRWLLLLRLELNKLELSPAVSASSFWSSSESSVKLDSFGFR